MSVAVVLGFYLVSLQVAAERKRLNDVDVQIAAAERDIRALETEFDTRANLAQLEKWNGDTLALTAPVAGQFVTDEAALASLDLRGTGEGDGEGEVRTAALVVPSLPTIVPATLVQAPVTQTAALSVPAPAPTVTVRVAAASRPAVASRTAPPTPLPATRPASVRVAAVTRPTPLVAPVVEARRTEAARAVAAVAKVRPQAVAMLDRKLLSDSTLGDLLASAKAEAGRRR